MDNALIDDRQIHVDFSQSVTKLWSQYRNKGSRNGKGGGGCFKCGATDHIAKDCTGGDGAKQHPKYVLKDDNQQRGGNNNSRYEMIFDEETPESPRREKRDGRRDQDRQKVHGRSLEDIKHRVEEKKDPRDRPRETMEHKDDDDGHWERKMSRYHEEQIDRRKDQADDRRYDRDYRKRSSDVEDHRDGREGYRKRAADEDSNNHKRRYMHLSTEETEGMNQVIEITTSIKAGEKGESIDTENVLTIMNMITTEGIWPIGVNKEDEVLDSLLKLGSVVSH